MAAMSFDAQHRAIPIRIDETTDSIFGDFPISYNTQFHYYHCDDCRIPIASPSNHLTSVHSYSRARIADKVLTILAKYHEADHPNDYLPSTISIENPYPIHIPDISYSPTGFACLYSGCKYISETKNGINSHFPAKHGMSISSSTHLYRQCSHIQSFFPSYSSHRLWFPSSPPAPISTPSKRITIKLNVNNSTSMPSSSTASSSRTLRPNSSLTDERGSQIPRRRRRRSTSTSSLDSLTPTASPNKKGQASSSVEQSGYITKDSLFGTLPFEYHPQFHFFRCTQCGVGIQCLAKHFGRKSSHPDIPVLSNNVIFQRIKDKYPEEDPYLHLLSPNISTSKPWPEHIQGIDSAERGFACNGTGCTFVTANLNTVLSHLWRKHPNQGATWRPASNLQRFFTRLNQPDWFPSSAPLETSHSKTTERSKPTISRNTDESRSKRIRRLTRIPTRSPSPIPSSSSISSAPSRAGSPWRPESASPDPENRPNPRYPRRPRTTKSVRRGPSRASKSGNLQRTYADSSDESEHSSPGEDEVEVETTARSEDRKSMKQPRRAVLEVIIIKDGRSAADKARDLLEKARKKKQEWEEAEAMAQAALVTAAEALASKYPGQIIPRRAEGEEEELNVEEEQVPGDDWFEIDD